MSTINLEPPEVEVVEIPVVGETPLIMHRWSEKARKEMLDKQTGKTRQKKAPKDPVADYEAAKYQLEDGRLAMPAVAFKAAIVDGARMFEGVKMTELRQVIHVFGEGRDQYVAVDGEPRMREDAVRVGMTTDLRYRPEIWPWQSVLTIRYVKRMLSLDTLVHLVNAGGMGGVGEWRPSRSKTGSYGTFRVMEGAL